MRGGVNRTTTPRPITRGHGVSVGHFMRTLWYTVWYAYVLITFLCKGAPFRRIIRSRSDSPSASHLHHDDTGFEFSFACAFVELFNTFLNPLTDLLLSTFLAYRAGNVLDFNEVRLYCRSA
jgi:hypothetical protein